MAILYEACYIVLNNFRVPEQRLYPDHRDHLPVERRHLDQVGIGVLVNLVAVAASGA